MVTVPVTRVRGDVKSKVCAAVLVATVSDLMRRFVAI
jgi:hypothetical protein